jgi:hypothetical protein
MTLSVAVLVLQSGSAIVQFGITCIKELSRASLSEHETVSNSFMYVPVTIHDTKRRSRWPSYVATALYFFGDV